MSKVDLKLKERIYDEFVPISQDLDKVAINARSHNLMRKILKENPWFEEIMQNSSNEVEALVGIKNWALSFLKENPEALKIYNSEFKGDQKLKALRWSDLAAIRLLDYVDNAGRSFEDLNLRGRTITNNPIKMMWLAIKFGTGGAQPPFFEDMLNLFRQLKMKTRHKLPSKKRVHEWMERWPSGLDPRITKLRDENRNRILNVIIDRIDKEKSRRPGFAFEPGMSREEKFKRALEWWKDPHFHLSFAIRSPDLFNEMLGYSLDPDTMRILYEAQAKGMPFFINPYYLSLLHVRVPYFAIGADMAIRDYVIYSQQLVDEFGHIVAWEREDRVQPGKANAAGWLLPESKNVHRRYPDVAILIPDTVGRACGGLCASCQRMYDFQAGHFNFNLEDLMPQKTWPEKLNELMQYFESDSQLRDILITGGDALMSSDESLEEILEAVYKMAVAKIKANKSRKKGEKFAEMVRIRLGTRLPVYLPQRITDNLVKILKAFKTRAVKLGIKQFFIQTHFESPMEITPEACDAIRKILSSGWVILNQHVLTTSSSLRGHTGKLRSLLNDIGVLNYYTFTCKGYRENQHNFATNARALQELREEKVCGKVPKKYHKQIQDVVNDPLNMAEQIEQIRETAGLPFLATDRTVQNLQGVGKSLTYRVIGITRGGRRILEFEHDVTRHHSPIIEKMGRAVVIESKSLSEFLNQLKEIGEDLSEYESIWGYSMGETETRFPLFEYPEYDYTITEEMTNLKLG